MYNLLVPNALMEKSCAAVEQLTGFNNILSMAWCDLPVPVLTVLPYSYEPKFIICRGFMKFCNKVGSGSMLGSCY